MPAGDVCWCCGCLPCKGVTVGPWLPDPLYPWTVDPYVPPTITWPSTTTTWPQPERLHPDDIEAIAKRVAELLKAPV